MRYALLLFLIVSVLSLSYHDLAFYSTPQSDCCPGGAVSCHLGYAPQCSVQGCGDPCPRSTMRWVELKHINYCDCDGDGRTDCYTSCLSSGAGPFCSGCDRDICGAQCESDSHCGVPYCEGDLACRYLCLSDLCLCTTVASCTTCKYGCTDGSCNPPPSPPSPSPPLPSPPSPPTTRCPLNTTGNVTISKNCEIIGRMWLKDGNLTILPGVEVTMVANSTFIFEPGYKIIVNGRILKSAENTIIRKEEIP